ncbi:hypothetical protein ACTFIZ_007907 [Dictyostelium cf. discoideum]
MEWKRNKSISKLRLRSHKKKFNLIGEHTPEFFNSNQELQLATEEGSIQSHPTSIRSNPYGSICISPEPSNHQLLYNQNECTPPRLESMETMSGVPPILLPSILEKMNSSSSKKVSIILIFPNWRSATWYPMIQAQVPSHQRHMFPQVLGTFRESIFGIQNSGTAELLMKSWEQSTIKVYNSSYTRFLNFCTLNSLDPSSITLVMFMDYLTHLFKIKPPLAFSTINNHRSMLNQLLLLRNQTDIVNDPFITRIMTGIHKLLPSSAKYKEIWDANKVFKYLSTIKVLPKFTYTALLNKTLVICKMFGLARSSDLVNLSFKGLNITTDSIRGPVINAKEQRKDGVLSILELTSLDDTYSQVCPVRHLTTYLKSTKERRKKHQSCIINSQSQVLILPSSNLTLLVPLWLSNNVPFHVVKKMGRWKSKDTVDTFYDKRIIGEKSGGFLNNVVQLS